MTARKIANTQVATDAAKTASTGVDSDTVTVSAASSFAITLDKYTDYTHLVIHITNQGGLTALTGTMALTCGTNGSTITVPAGVIVAGSLPNPSASASYDNLIIIKAGFFTKLKLSYTATSGSGSLNIRVTASNVE
jgi:pectate lyase